MKGLIVVGVVLAVLAAGMSAVLLVWQPWEGGIEIEYALVVPPDLSPRDAAEKAARVLERRAAALAMDAAAFGTGDGRVGLRLAGMNPPDAAAFRAAFEQRGRLELLVVADRVTQERYNADGQLPPGWRAGRPPPVPPGMEYEPWSKGPVLLAEPPVVETADVIRARPETAMVPAGTSWQVVVELRAEAAARFDEAAKRLYARRPPGMVAIVVDGRIVSMPSIMAETFGGTLVVAGAKDREEAQAWATALAGGELPCMLRQLDVRLYRGKLRR